jgi:GR25 family glycosyltransferase involved in LPS biosynthesis
MSHLEVVIAIEGKPRNTTLVSDLEEMDVFDSVIILQAVRPKTLSNKFISDQQKGSFIILSRWISQTEVATKASHTKAYQLAYETGYSYLSVFEDDAVITEKNKFKDNLNNINNSTEHLIYTYYSPKWSLWKKTTKGTKSVFPPPSAVAYTINQATMLRAISEISFGVADWPTWSRKVKFYLLENSGITHLGSDSFNEASRSRYKEHKLSLGIRFKNLLFNLSYDSLYFNIFVPLAWKTAILTAQVIRKRKKNEVGRIIF